MSYFLRDSKPKTQSEYEAELLAAKKRRAVLMAQNDEATAQIAELSAQARIEITRDFARCGTIDRDIQKLASEINTRRGQCNVIERALPQISLMASVAKNWTK